MQRHIARGPRVSLSLHILLVIGLLALMTTWGCSGDPRVDTDYQHLTEEGEAFVMLPVVIGFEPINAPLKKRLGGKVIASLEVTLEEEDEGARYASPVSGIGALGMRLKPGRYVVGGVRDIEVLGCSSLEVSGLARPMTFDVERGDDVVYAGRLQMMLRLVEWTDGGASLCRVELTTSVARDCLSRDLVLYQREFTEVDWSGLRVRSGITGDHKPCTGS